MQQIEAIIIQVVNGLPLSDEESIYLQEWRASSFECEALYMELTNEERLKEELLIRQQFDGHKAWKELQRQQRKAVVYNFRWWAAAAAVVFIIAGAITYTMYDKPGRDATGVPVAVQHDVPPGKEGAILTLADGRQVSLDTVKNATVALQGGVTAKVVNGSLVYEGKGEVVAYNTMTTPKGRHFQVTLPDGTKVWLNAASSIRYPTIFMGAERRVEVSGEAYFEVTKNPTKPFLVNVAGKAEVEVLGTQFNVNAYENEESINTTLLEGSVRVILLGQKIRPGREVILQPGQQAQIAAAIRVIPNADVDKVIAWKNGLFNFEGATLQEVMKQLERWYDIEVVYEKDVPKMELTGEMTKGVTLNGLLIVLEKLGVHYRLEGRKLIVLP